MTSSLDRLRRNYLAAFVAHASRSDEGSLHPAYELGRNALARDISLLDLVRTHHSVLGEVLQAGNGVDTPRDLLDTAAAFLVEALAPFEIARRGFMETSTPQHDRIQPDSPSRPPYTPIRDTIGGQSGDSLTAPHD